MLGISTSTKQARIAYLIPESKTRTSVRSMQFHGAPKTINHILLSLSLPLLLSVSLSGLLSGDGMKICQGV